MTENEEPIELEEIVQLILHGDGGHPRRPVLIATAFVLKAFEEPTAADIPITDVVADGVEFDLQAVRESLEGFGLATWADLLSPDWAMVPLLRTDQPEPFRPGPGRVYRARGIYLRYLDLLKDWRVAVLGPSDLPVDSLPT